MKDFIIILKINSYFISKLIYFKMFKSFQLFNYLIVSFFVFIVIKKMLNFINDFYNL